MRDVRERFNSIKQLKQETKDISNLSEDEKKVYWRSKELVVNLVVNELKNLCNKYIDSNLLVDSYKKESKLNLKCNLPNCSIFVS